MYDVIAGMIMAKYQILRFKTLSYTVDTYPFVSFPVLVVFDGGGV